MSPVVSIITPVYNAEKYLLETIASVQAQTFEDYEHLLIIDAKSIDNSLQISLLAQEKDRRIRVIQDPKALGPALNRNLGIDLARGEYLAFLDADDLWPKEKLQDQVEFSKSRNADFTFTSFSRMSQDGKRFSSAALVPDQFSYHDLLKLNVIAIHTALLKRNFVGPKRFPNTPHEDFAFWLDLLRPTADSKTVTAYGLKKPLAFYRSTPGSRAFHKKEAALWRWKILRDYENIPFPKALYYFCQYAVRASLLHRKTRL
jgi:teichuronic acid biosynthesis glycosyltransferase TuaG